MIKNIETKITIKKAGKIIAEKSLINNILYNYSNFMLSNTFPYDPALYPEFDGSITFPLPYSYLTTTTQAITKNSNTMSYNIKTPVIFENNENSYSKVEVSGGFARYELFYTFNIPVGLNGSTLKGLGFGQNDEAEDIGFPAVSDWLLAYLEVPEMVLLTDMIIEVVRIDEIRTDGLAIGNCKHLALDFDLGIADFVDIANLNEVCLCDENLIPFNSKNIGDLTLTRKPAQDGFLFITGFPEISLMDGELLYPSEDLYPSLTLFPTGANVIKYVVYKYSVTRYSFTSGTSEIIYTYQIKKRLIDIDSSFNGQEFELQYGYEKESDA